jgi:vacuolar-type H+-ATPase subunit I/STV1
MAKPTKFLGLLLSDWYTEDYVVAVIDDLEEARDAARELHRAGFGEGEVRVFDGPQVAEQLDEIERRRSLLERAVVSVRNTASDESIISEDYEEEAREGHHIVVVHAETQEQVDQAYQILRVHHGHAIEHFGRWVITDLWQEDMAHP